VVKKRGSAYFSPSLLTKALQQAGLDEGDLGRLLGLPRRDIERYVSGDRRPRLDRVAEMASHLDVEATALMALPVEPTMESLREGLLVERIDAAAAARVDLATLQRLEAGQSTFKQEEAKRLAKLYRCDLATVVAAIETSHGMLLAAMEHDRVQSVRLRLATSDVERLDAVRGDQSRAEWIKAAIWRAKPK